MIFIFINLSSDKVIRSRDVIGIFDLDTSTVKKVTRDFLKNHEKTNKIESLSNELPRSFIVHHSKNKNIKIFLSPITSTTLIKTKSN